MLGYAKHYFGKSCPGVALPCCKHSLKALQVPFSNKDRTNTYSNILDKRLTNFKLTTFGKIRNVYSRLKIFDKFQHFKGKVNAYFTSETTQLLNTAVLFILFEKKTAHVFGLEKLSTEYH